MNLEHQFNTHFKQNFESYFQPKSKCIVAVSGGIDSVVLVYLMLQNKINFEIAHCNFNLRNAESDRDENFVIDLAKKLNINCFIKNFDTEQFATENKLSIQLAARKLRYDWFRTLQIQDNKLTHYLLTAHHKNDNIETVLFNFCRGTGIQGLTGIKSFDSVRKIIRPLLPFSKQQIVEYAQKNKLAFVEDSSNNSLKYTRNSFRNEILPLLKNHFNQIEDNITNNITRLNQTELIYKEAIYNYEKKLIEQKESEIHIPILKLIKTGFAETLIYEITKKYNFTSAQVSEIIKLCSSNNGSFVQSATHTIFKNRHWLIITLKSSQESKFLIIEKNTSKVEFNLGVLQVEMIEQNININSKVNQSKSNYVEYLDYNKIEFPLIVRQWKEGDYFYPLGMQKKQKLSRFFINQKLSQIQKNNVWVIESNKKIICILNFRIDDRFKVKNSSNKLLKISLLNNH